MKSSDRSMAGRLHVPVLGVEVCKVFEGEDLRVFFEGTVGAGGHAEMLLEGHPEIEVYIACDRDPSALAVAKPRLARWEKKLTWVQGAFADVALHVKGRGLLDGFLIDVGVSSMQLDQKERGFSFQEEAFLDMRMDPDQGLTAAEIVGTWSENELADLFYHYGEERRSRQIAREIVRVRGRYPIETTRALADLIVKQTRGRGRIHPATRVFQALRIAVNDELKQLEQGLRAATALLREGGRLAVISFHSLEDRIAKHFFRETTQFETYTKKPVVPTREEVRQNPRSRSAKLRAGIKRGGECDIKGSR
jgi:16S rRNA (cytosine1402-N4)-methyltransferase